MCTTYLQMNVGLQTVSMIRSLIPEVARMGGDLTQMYLVKNLRPDLVPSGLILSYVFTLLYTCRVD